MTKTELTESEYAIAIKNGISRQLAKRRFEQWFWNEKDAITKPVKKGNHNKYDDLWEKWSEIAIKKGIDRDVFLRRIKDGLSEEEAATKRKLGRITPELIKKAAENGISKDTLRRRINQYHWPVKKAISVPLYQRHIYYDEKGKNK